MVTLEETNYPDTKARTLADLALAFGIVSFTMAVANVAMLFRFVGSHSVRNNARVANADDFDGDAAAGKKKSKGKSGRRG